MNDTTNAGMLNTLPTDTGVQPSGLVPNTPYSSMVQNIARQLQINEVITFAEFNARVASSPDYPKVIHLNRLRILVVLGNFQCTTNRHLADVVMFVKQGIISVERCKYGPPGYSVDYQRANVFNLLFGIKHSGNTVICWPREEREEHEHHEHRDPCHPCKPEPICPECFPAPIVNSLEAPPQLSYPNYNYPGFPCPDGYRPCCEPTCFVPCMVHCSPECLSPCHTHGFPRCLPECPSPCPHHLFPFGDGNCAPGFPPPICPPQTQTLENPRPPERPLHQRPEGLGFLELFGTEALEGKQGGQDSVFGGRHGDHEDGEGGTGGEV